MVRHKTLNLDFVHKLTKIAYLNREPINTRKHCESRIFEKYMFELFRVHRDRHLMYQQARMESEQPNIVEKLGDLPVINDAYNQVLDIYERTKGHNVLFRTSFGLAEYATKTIVGKAVPCIYNRYTQPAIGKVNDIACNTLGVLEEKYPIITSSKEEIFEEGKSKAEAVYMMPALAPVRKGLQMSKSVAEAGLDVGKTAVNVGTAVASTALSPARFACRVGTSIVRTGANVSLTAAEMSMDVMWSVLDRMYVTGEQTAELLVQSPCGQACLEQFDLTLDATEKLLSQYLPLETMEEKEGDAVPEIPSDRAARVTQMAQRVHKAMLDKAKGDMVRFRLMAGSFLQELLEITGYYLTLTKDTAQMVWADRQYYMNSFDAIWNKYVQFIPESVRPTDPLKRAAAVLQLVVSRLAELLGMVLKFTLKSLNSSSDLFLKWCKQAQIFLQTHGTGDLGLLMTYFANIFPRLADIVQWLVQSAVLLIDSLQCSVLSAGCTRGDDPR